MPVSTNLGGNAVGFCWTIADSTWLLRKDDDSMHEVLILMHAVVGHVSLYLLSCYVRIVARSLWLSLRCSLESSSSAVFSLTVYSMLSIYWGTRNPTTTALRLLICEILDEILFLHYMSATKKCQELFHRHSPVFRQNIAGGREISKSEVYRI